MNNQQSSETVLLSAFPDPSVSDKDIDCFKIIAVDRLGIRRTPETWTIVPKEAIDGKIPFTADPSSRTPIVIGDSGRYEISGGYIHCYTSDGHPHRVVVANAWDLVSVEIYKCEIKAGTPYYTDGIHFVCAEKIMFVELGTSYEFSEEDDDEEI